MHKSIFVLIIVCLLCFTGRILAENGTDEIPSSSRDVILQDTLAYRLEKISWVEVLVEGQLLKEHKQEFERLIRLRLRNDLSMIPHEVKRLSQAITDGLSESEFKKRGAIACLVWTVGDDYPVAILVECKLWGYGGYRGFGLYNEFTDRYLGYGSKQTAKSIVEDMIRGAITSISADFLEARDKVRIK